MKKILIVDDEPDLCEPLVKQMIKRSWEVATASNGREGLLRLADFHPDVILADIMMPEMTGLEMLRHISDQNCEIPVIFITGYTDTSKMREAWGLGAFDLIDKPFDFGALVAVIDNAYEYGVEYVRSARKRFAKLKRAS